MNADARKALGRVLLECDPKHVDELVTVVFALRDQDAEIARLRAFLRHVVEAHTGDNRDGCDMSNADIDRITAHLGAEQ